MPRTTINIDAPMLKDLKRLQKRTGQSLGRLVSDLLAEAIGPYQTGQPEPPAFHWNSRPMIARVDLSDKEAVYAALEEGRKPSSATGRRL